MNKVRFMITVATQDQVSKHLRHHHHYTAVSESKLSSGLVSHHDSYEIMIDVKIQICLCTKINHSNMQQWLTS